MGISLLRCPGNYNYAEVVVKLLYTSHTTYIHKAVTYSKFHAYLLNIRYGKYNHNASTAEGPVTIFVEFQVRRDVGKEIAHMGNIGT